MEKIESTPESTQVQELKRDLETRQVVKKFTSQRHADKVCLLEGEIVKKHYPETKENRRYFQKEIKMMEHLKDCPFVAKLIHADPDTLTLYITYCGEQPKRTKKNLDRVAKAAKKLRKTWGVRRLDDHGKTTYKIYFGNIGVKNGEINFFDLASDKWKIEKWAKNKSIQKTEIKNTTKKITKITNKI